MKEDSRTWWNAKGGGILPWSGPSREYVWQSNSNFVSLACKKALRQFQYWIPFSFDTALKILVFISFKSIFSIPLTWMFVFFDCYPPPKSFPSNHEKLLLTFHENLNIRLNIFAITDVMTKKIGRLEAQSESSLHTAKRERFVAMQQQQQEQGGELKAKIKEHYDDVSPYYHDLWGRQVQKKSPTYQLGRILFLSGCPLTDLLSVSVCMCVLKTHPPWILGDWRGEQESSTDAAHTRAGQEGTLAPPPCSTSRARRR